MGLHAALPGWLPLHGLDERSREADGQSPGAQSQPLYREPATGKRFTAGCEARARRLLAARGWPGIAIGSGTV